MRSGARRPSRLFAMTAVVTAVTTYLLIIVGGVVRTTGSGLGCGASGGRNDWPFCQGRLLPPLEEHAVIEFSHRWLAATVVAGALGILVAAWLRYRHLRGVTVAASLFSVFLVLQVVLGAVTVYRLLPPEVVMAHLANAELLLGCAVLLCVLAVSGGAGGRPVRDPDVGWSRAARWSALAALATFGLVVSGAFVVARGAGFDCAGWPLCGNGLQVDAGRLAVYNLAHRALAGIAGAVVGIAAVLALRSARGVRGVRPAALAVVALLAAQVLAGALLVETRLPAGVRSLHEALASALWAAVALLALLLRHGAAGSEAVPAPLTAEAGDGAARRHPATSPRALPS